MVTEIFKLPQDEDAAYKRAAQVLREGGLVAFPTETVYGLGADALDPEASKKIYEAKGRPSDNPLIVHVADMESVEKLSDDISEESRKLMETFWPGPLTIILKVSDRVPKTTTGGLSTVAVRMPDHPVALRMIKESGVLVAAPSANTSGRPSPTRAEHVMEDLKSRIDVILDGGMTGIGVESTIVDMTGDVPTILRPGYVTKEMLENVLVTVRIDPSIEKINEGHMPDDDAPPKAPGMKYRHYAPKAVLTVVSGDEEAVKRKLSELAAIARIGGKKVGVICSDAAGLEKYADKVYSVGDASDRLSLSRQLYNILRKCDEDGLDVVYSDDFGLENDQGLGFAIQNRLMKAAGGNLVQESEDE